jgi:hypothetical protein
VQPDVAFTVVPDPPTRKLLMAAGARALGDERTEFGVRDLLSALAADAEAASALAALGVDVQAMREGIRRHGTPEEPAG